MMLSGRVRVDQRTKKLLQRIKRQEIAIIDHPDLDELAAIDLVDAGVKVVINAQASISGKYPNLGPLILLKSGVPLLDNAGPAVLKLQDGDEVEIRGEDIYCRGLWIGSGQWQSLASISNLMEESKANLPASMESFVVNTLLHAGYERHLILGDLKLPVLTTDFLRKHTLIVTRGKGYREDLQAISSYIAERKPVLVGVDGGADALLECGYRPQLIFGDMDSISDTALACGAEMVVHAYAADGSAPGLKRLDKLGLTAQIFPAAGTSEDAAMLLAYHAGAALIVAVGTHTHMIDFLEKGRPGMSSTLLTRIKVGSILVDAKGVSKLYGQPKLAKPMLKLVLAAAFPLLMLAAVSPLITQLARLCVLRIKLLLLF